MQSGSVQKRKSSIKACLRCHRRKQRCVGYPTCTNCEAAKTSCGRDSTPVMRHLAGLSKEELLKKIESLEEQLSASNVNENERTPQSPQASHYPGSCSSHGLNLFSLPDTRAIENAHGHSIQNGQRTRILSSDRAVEDPDANTSLPAYVNSEWDGWNGGLSDENTIREQISSPESATTSQAQNLPWPDDETGARLLTTYLESMHRRLPFCDYIELLEKDKTRPAGSLIPISPSFPLFRLFMAYAIGASVLKLTGTYSAREPSDFLDAAMRIKGSLGTLDPIMKIEAMLWVTLFSLRSSINSEVWYTIGLAMRTSVEIGLHREHYYHGLDHQNSERQKRLFWAIYALERNICWSLKRPFSLADYDIDATLPSPATLPTDLLDNSSEINHRSELESDSRRPIDLRIFIATIELSRMKSRTYNEINRVDQPVSITYKQVPPLLERIRQFEAALPRFKGSDHDFLQLHVKNAVRMLIEPFLSILPSSDDLLRVCVEAAGSLCQLFKKLRVRRSLGYSFTMLNSVFVAGMTICYILFRNPSLWAPARANDLRACSSTLFAIAEKNGAVKKYCDVLETVINTVMDHVGQVASSGDLATPEDNQSSEDEHDSPKTPRVAFGSLGQTLKKLDFEFPPNSYPCYVVQGEDLPKDSSTRTHTSSIENPNVSEGTFAPFPNDHADTDESFGSYANTLMAEPWDFMDLYNESIDVSSAGYLPGGDQAVQQTVDELLSKALHPS